MRAALALQLVGALAACYGLYRLVGPDWLALALGAALLAVGTLAELATRKGGA